jgi:hypothetical protein
MNVQKVFGLMALVLALALSACTTTRASKSPPMKAKAKWVVLPAANRSTTPQAGERLEAILLAGIRTRGVTAVDPYVSNKDAETQILESDDQRILAAQEYARAHGYQYALAGTVLEWGYKGDGDAAVGLSVRVIDVPTGATIFVATGSRTGWGRANVTGDAVTLTEELLDAIKIEP